MLVRFLFLGSIVWVAAIFVAPFGFDLPYLFGSFICHQRPARSFWVAGAPMPVCARCTGLYASASAGAAFAFAQARLGRSRARGGPSNSLRASTVRTILLVAAIPTAATLIVEWLGLVNPGSVARFLAALPLGAAAAWVVVTAARKAS